MLPDQDRVKGSRRHKTMKGYYRRMVENGIAESPLVVFTIVVPIDAIRSPRFPIPFQRWDQKHRERVVRSPRLAIRLSCCPSSKYNARSIRFGL